MSGIHFLQIFRLIGKLKWAIRVHHWAEIVGGLARQLQNLAAELVLAFHPYMDASSIHKFKALEQRLLKSHLITTFIVSEYRVTIHMFIPYFASPWHVLF